MDGSCPGSRQLHITGSKTRLNWRYDGEEAKTEAEDSRLIVEEQGL